MANDDEVRLTPRAMEMRRRIADLRASGLTLAAFTFGGRKGSVVQRYPPGKHVEDLRDVVDAAFADVSTLSTVASDVAASVMTA